MKKLNVKRMNDTELATLYCKLERVLVKHENTFYKKFENTYNLLNAEINRRNRARIFKVACRVLRNGNFNQFVAASHYADAVLNGCGYFTFDHYHEIGSFYTKSKNPVIIDLVCWHSKV